MRLRTTIGALLMGSLALGPFVGCESLPGNEKSQGAVIGGAGGAAAGAAVAGKGDRIEGALLGGLLGAGGGYLIGAHVEKTNEKEAREAAEHARANPAKADDALAATTADLNSDGFVTLDEVVALEKSGLNDREIVSRLQRTDQYFELTASQEAYLRDRGVSDDVIVAMRDMDPVARTAAERIESGDAVISRDAEQRN